VTLVVSALFVLYSLPSTYILFPLFPFISYQVSVVVVVVGGGGSQSSTSNTGGGYTSAPILSFVSLLPILVVSFVFSPRLNLHLVPFVIILYYISSLSSRRQATSSNNSTLLPVYHAHHKAPSLLQSLTASQDTRRIFYFLLLTLSFMFVELLVGLFTGSLGLVSDAGHMFFDSASLFIGLYASFASTWPRDAAFTYGYARYETIAGFVNALFLAFVAVLVLLESVERLFNPPEVRTGGLLLTSVLGFVINMIGVVFFHDLSHGSSHDDDQHASHSHTHSHSHSHNDNLHGVYLHVLADTLGSVGVIVSSLLIQWKGWWIADPLCSLCISVLIFASVIPLLQSTFASLMLATPPELAGPFYSLIGKVRARPQVLQVTDAHVWRQSSKCVVASVRVALHKDVGSGSPDPQISDEITRLLQTGLLQDVGCQEICIEVV